MLALENSTPPLDDRVCNSRELFVGSNFLLNCSKHGCVDNLRNFRKYFLLCYATLSFISHSLPQKLTNIVG
jgi:hypothetical protein